MLTLLFLICFWIFTIIATLTGTFLCVRWALIKTGTIDPRNW